MISVFGELVAQKVQRSWDPEDVASHGKLVAEIKSSLPQLQKNLRKLVLAIQAEEVETAKYFKMIASPEFIREYGHYEEEFDSPNTFGKSLRKL
jgi:hypothetical protein